MVSLIVEGLVVLLAIWALTDAYRVNRRIAAEEIKAVRPGVTTDARRS